jgi:hypothetical protein
VPGPEHASDLAHSGREIVKVRMGERRYRSVERFVGERQSTGVGKDERCRRMAASRNSKLIARCVGADRLPTKFHRDVQEVAAAATHVEADTVSGTEQPLKRVTNSLIGVGAEKGVVLISQAVV